MKRPHKRLKIEKFPTVVLLLFLAHTHTRDFTKDEYREKASIKTLMVARQENDILVVTDLEKVLYDDAVNQAASHRQVGISTSGNNRPFCFSGVHDSWETSHNTYGHYLLSPIELWPFAVVSHIATIHVHAKNSNGTTVVQILIFCVVVSHPSFCSLRHYASCHYIVLLMNYIYT